MRGVENVCRLNAQFQGARFLYRDRLAQVHVKRDLPRPLDNVTPGIAKGTAGGIDACATRTGGAGAEGRRRATKRRGVEPFQSRRRGQRNRSAGCIGAKRAAYAAVDIQRITEYVRGDIKSRADGEIAAPLPVIQNMRKRPTLNKPVPFSKGQLVDPVTGEFMALVK